jgi:hypothetical protein
MSNELTISENPGAAGAGSATGEATGTEQSGGASLPAAGVGRRALIEQIMRTDIDRYYSEGLDRELAQILEGDQVAANPDAGTPTRPMDADLSRTQLCSSDAGRRLVADWDEMGGFRTHLSRVQQTVGEIVKEAGTNLRQRYFMERFDQDVPEAARYAVYAEIANGAPAYVVPAVQSAIDRFKATPAGEILVREWGSDSAEAVAILRVRARRLNDALSDDDAHEFWFWLDEQTPEAAAAIFRKLAR